MNSILEDKKLTFTQLPKKFLAFYGNLKFITVLTTACHWFLY